MSDSRLEKFIYAICSMDVSDLPVPLSRIEKLWNCLITGETPDFEPLSRNEKYLMAMLDRYDISNLPAPMSRGEKLLYKIAVGETDLSDVPDYLSRYEELLKYLIENGGISGGDFEYVLHTLNQSLNTLYPTAAKPVKSAILKGQTLVNLSGNDRISNTGFSTYADGVYKHLNDVNHYYDSLTINDNTTSMFSPNKTYTFIIDSKVLLSEVDGYTNPPRQHSVVIQFEDDTYQTPTTPFQNVGERIEQKIKFTIENKPIKKMSIRTFTASLSKTGKFNGEVYKMVLVEGDYSNQDIPYFEGMQSVKMPVLKAVGKNLLDPNYLKEQCLKISSSATYTDGNIVFNSKAFNEKRLIALDFEPNTRYAFNLKMSGQPNSQLHIKVHYTDSTTTFHTPYIADWIGTISDATKANATVDYITISYGNGAAGCVLYVDECSLFKSDTVMPHEPYKSNILSTPSDLELRGIGDVQDTLNCLTGEMTKRIGEVVLDGSEDGWRLSGGNTNELRYGTMYPNSSVELFSKTLNDKFINGDMSKTDILNYIYATGSSNGLVVTVDKTKLETVDINGFKKWLSQNPITVQYQLATESIKTVDLTVVDQDGNETKLRTFDDTTHVLLNSEGLIPTAALTVRTKIPSASSTSLLMDDISTEQQQLNTTVNEQSNNVDATMIATTEIFEETL